MLALAPGYAPIWAGDQRRKLFDNFKAYAQMTRGQGRVWVVAITAPGAAPRLVASRRGTEAVRGLPWDKGRCAHLGPHKHSGELGCKVSALHAAGWNARAPAYWSSVHRRASQLARREHPGLWMLGRVWEVQKRGVLHVHVVLGYSTPEEILAANAYVGWLSALAPRYRFGFVDRKRSIKSARAAAAYLSAYFVTGKRGKATLRESVMSNAMPRSIVHVSNGLTQATGVTMRELRYRRFVWFIGRRYGMDPGLARVFADLQRWGLVPSNEDLIRIACKLPQGP